MGELGSLGGAWRVQCCGSASHTGGHTRGHTVHHHWFFLTPLHAGPLALGWLSPACRALWLAPF